MKKDQGITLFPYKLQCGRPLHGYYEYPENRRLRAQKARSSVGIYLFIFHSQHMEASRCLLP